MTADSIKKPTAQSPQIVSLAIEAIVPDPDQPRKTVTPDGLRGLTQSLQESGQISPILVRPGTEGKYTLLVGERRWRAARDAGLSHVECIIRDDVDEQKAREMQLAENYQREDIPPLEQARSFREYIDMYGVSQSELSRRTGIPQRTISDRLALLSLPASVHARLEAGEIGPYEAVKIAALPSEQQEAVAREISSGKISGRMLEKLVKGGRANSDKLIQQVKSEIDSPDVSPVSGNDAMDPHRPELESIVHKDVEDLLAVAKELGVDKRGGCPFFEGDRCLIWAWDSKESIPLCMGEPVKGEHSWLVQPSPLLCALCYMELNRRLFEVERNIETNPLSDVKKKFRCECGSKGFVAVAIECTKCGKKTWWGWFPDQ